MPDPRRGFVPEDEKEFNEDSQLLLRKAQKEILYLMEQGYPIKNSSTFVGNHYMLSERQRMAIVRATAEKKIVDLRSRKQLTKETLGSNVFIDGLNTIITLEVALSEGTLIRCMDGTIRDLAGLRGTYRLISQTDEAILLIGEKLFKLQIDEVIFYLDAPVSNTGRLKARIQDILKTFPYQSKVELVNNADVILEKLNSVVTSDAIILNKCNGWYNLIGEIINDKLRNYKFVDLSKPDR